VTVRLRQLGFFVALLRCAQTLLPSPKLRVPVRPDTALQQYSYFMVSGDKEILDDRCSKSDAQPVAPPRHPKDESAR